MGPEGTHAPQRRGGGGPRRCGSPLAHILVHTRAGWVRPDTPPSLLLLRGEGGPGHHPPPTHLCTLDPGGGGQGPGWSGCRRTSRRRRARRRHCRWTPRRGTWWWAQPPGPKIGGRGQGGGGVEGGGEKRSWGGVDFSKTTERIPLIAPIGSRRSPPERSEWWVGGGFGGHRMGGVIPFPPLTAQSPNYAQVQTRNRPGSQCLANALNHAHPQSEGCVGATHNDKIR